MSSHFPLVSFFDVERKLLAKKEVLFEEFCALLRVKSVLLRVSYILGKKKATLGFKGMLVEQH